MNLEGYLFTINKNNSFRLDPDELKDVAQDIRISFHNESLNDFLKKKRIITLYSRAVNSKIKNEKIVSECGYLDNYSPGEHATQVKRMSALPGLVLNETQEKIVTLLIGGYSYEEIRKKLKLNENQLWAHIQRIKKSNCGRSH